MLEKPCRASVIKCVALAVDDNPLQYCVVHLHHPTLHPMSEAEAKIAEEREREMIEAMSVRL